MCVCLRSILLNVFVFKQHGGEMDRWSYGKVSLINKQVKAHARLPYISLKSNASLPIPDYTEAYMWKMHQMFSLFAVWESVQKLRAVHVHYTFLSCTTFPSAADLTVDTYSTSSLPTICSQYLLDLQYIVLHERAKPQTTGSLSQLLSTMDTYCI